MELDLYSNPHLHSSSAAVDNDDSRNIRTIVPHDLERVEEENEEQIANQEEEEEEISRRAIMLVASTISALES